jgi:hypothetical protein
MSASDIARKMIDETERSLSVKVPHGFGVDLVSYSWVGDYLKDQNIRQGIADHEVEIHRVKKSPIAKEDLKVLFFQSLEAIRNDRLQYLRAYLKQAQHMDETALTPPPPAIVKRDAYRESLCLDFKLSEQDVDAIFADIQGGLTWEEKERRVVAIQKEIAELNATLEKKLNPHDRWFYRSDGQPLPYPRGCRWCLVVKVWKDVAARYSVPVDVFGNNLDDDRAQTAFYALGLDKVVKRPPLLNAGS